MPACRRPIQNTIPSALNSGGAGGQTSRWTSKPCAGATRAGQPKRPVGNIECPCSVETLLRRTAVVFLPVGRALLPVTCVKTGKSAHLTGIFLPAARLMLFRNEAFAAQLAGQEVQCRMGLFQFPGLPFRKTRLIRSRQRFTQVRQQRRDFFVGVYGSQRD